jgi:hypothetical protein
MMKFSEDKRGQMSVTGIIVATVVATIMLTVYFTIYNAMNLAALDATSRLIVGFFGLFICIVILMGIVRYLQ